ncbi:MAG: hypothetical protein VX405_04960 [Myxococcota bacterium]|jgi:hypothetical protein|nr:hypothetical protein [Myxococcales bacterium]MEC7750841.1 hypothetical protein [Myxococcota bacterium]HBU47957.1 hypothetical protein [Myxococcales bacterium]|tara:strand:- start:2536 stop:3060 length:525 start_codon:yes stop_codon:yes gene_type:complete
MNTIGLFVLISAPTSASPKAPAPVKPPAVKVPVAPKVKLPALKKKLAPAPKKVPKDPAEIKPMRPRAFFTLRRRLRSASSEQDRLAVLQRGLQKWHLDINQSELLLKHFKREKVRIEAFKVIRPKMVTKKEDKVGWWTVDGADFRPAQKRRFQGLFTSQDGKSIVDFGGSQFKP